MNRFVLPAGVATIEISNRCNARCRWCTTGRENLKNQAAPSTHTHTHTAAGMTAQLFEDGVKRLIELGWISKEVTIIDLYNWGEPFLNSDLGSILHIVKEYGFRFRLSTNGSIYREIPADVLENMEYLMISMPGMTQDSYDKIHKLDMKKVHENIEKFSKDLAKAGFQNKLWFNFHVYQFNLGEIDAARKFAESIGANFTPHIAYFADNQLFDQFVSGTMKYEDLYEAAQQLFLNIYHMDTSDKSECRFWREIVFDAQFNLLSCVWVNSNEKLGNLFSDSPEKLLCAREEYKMCEQCMSYGKDKFLPVAPDWFFELIQDHKMELQERDERVQKLMDIEQEQREEINRLRNASEQTIGVKGALKNYFKKRFKI